MQSQTYSRIIGELKRNSLLLVLVDQNKDNNTENETEIGKQIGASLVIWTMSL